MLPSPTVTPSPPPPHAQQGLPRGFLIAVGVLLLAFVLPLIDLVRLALGSSLYSHLPLIPLASLYLVWIKRKALPAPSAPDRRLATLFLAAGGAVLGAYFAVTRTGVTLVRDDALAWLTYAFLFLFVGLCAWFFGRATLRALTFPLAFLIFMAPFPLAVHHGLEMFLQYTSADASYAMIRAAGTPILREGLVFHLPGIVLEVAPQCSGIRSTVALFITSLVAGHFFLRTPWKRAVLSLAVIPLAIARNGLRIFTIAQLCVHVSPDMVNTFIHHRGGPIFFALSLIPFFLLLVVLHRGESTRSIP